MHFATKSNYRSTESEISFTLIMIVYFVRYKFGQTQSQAAFSVIQAGGCWVACDLLKINNFVTCLPSFIRYGRGGVYGCLRWSCTIGLTGAFIYQRLTASQAPIATLAHRCEIVMNHAESPRPVCLWRVFVARW